MTPIQQSSISQSNQTRYKRIEKEEFKLPLIADYIILYNSYFISQSQPDVINKLKCLESGPDTACPKIYLIWPLRSSVTESRKLWLTATIPAPSGCPEHTLMTPHSVFPKQPSRPCFMCSKESHREEKESPKLQIPLNPCPECNQKGHWKMECRLLKMEKGTTSKKPPPSFNPALLLDLLGLVGDEDTDCWAQAPSYPPQKVTTSSCHLLSQG